MRRVSKERGDYDIDIDIGFGTYPDEPIPTNDSEEAWEDDEEDKSSAPEMIFNHFLGQANTKNNRARKHTYSQETYRTRLQTERKHWADQQEMLSEAFMRWKTSGPSMPEEVGEGVDQFVCHIFEISGA